MCVCHHGDFYLLFFLELNLYSYLGVVTMTMECSHCVVTLISDFIHSLIPHLNTVYLTAA